MSYYGSDIYDEIDSRIDAEERKESRLKRDISSFENKIGRLQTDRVETYRNLANVYLEELTAEGIDDIDQKVEELERAEEQVRNLYLEKQAARQKIEKDMLSSHQTKKNLQLKLKEQSTVLHEKSKLREQVQNAVVEELDKNKTYVNMVFDAEKAEQSYDRSVQRLDKWKEKVEAKKKVFENNKVFKYLYFKRQFGSAEYKGKGLLKKGDEWLANKVGLKDADGNKITFDQAKKSYERLINIPKTLEEATNNRKEYRDNFITKLNEYEKEVSDKHGLTNILVEMDDLTNKRNDVIAKITHEDNLYREYADQREKLQDTKGAYFGRALETLKKVLGSYELEKLREIAEQTPTRKDDMLVEKIYDINETIGDYRQQSKTLVEKRRELSSNISGLKDVLDDFEDYDYDASRSRFESDLDIEREMDRYMADRITKRQLWNKIDNAQYFKSTSSSSSSWNTSTSTTIFSSPGMGGSNIGFGGGGGGGSIGGWGGGGGGGSVGGW